MNAPRRSLAVLLAGGGRTRDRRRAEAAPASRAPSAVRRRRRAGTPRRCNCASSRARAEGRRASDRRGRAREAGVASSSTTAARSTWSIASTRASASTRSCRPTARIRSLALAEQAAGEGKAVLFARHARPETVEGALRSAGRQGADAGRRSRGPRKKGVSPTRMTNPTSSNTGMSALFAVASSIATRPEDLDGRRCQPRGAQEFPRRPGIAAGSSGWLADSYLQEQDRLDGLVNYEAVILRLNEQLGAA